MLAVVRHWWAYVLVAGLVVLMAFGLSSPFEKGGMAETDKHLALAGLLAGGLLLSASTGPRSWAAKVLLPLLAIPVLLLLSVALINLWLGYIMADPEKELTQHEFYCGLLYALVVVGFQALLVLYKRWRGTQ